MMADSYEVQADSPSDSSGDPCRLALANAFTHDSVLDPYATKQLADQLHAPDRHDWTEPLLVLRLYNNILGNRDRASMALQKVANAMAPYSPQEIAHAVYANVGDEPLPPE